MARKKEAEGNTEGEFVPPDFDKKEFVKKEMRDGYAAFGAITFAVVMGVFSFFIHKYLESAAAGILLGLLGVVGIRFIYTALNVDIEKFTAKNWFGNGAIYLITWLAIWILLINPPMNDVAPPDITVKTSTVLELTHNGTPDVAVVAYVYDNHHVEAVYIVFSESDMPSIQLGERLEMYNAGDGAWKYSPSGGFKVGNYTYHIVAEDSFGNIASTRDRSLEVRAARDPEIISIIPESVDGGVVTTNTISVIAGDNVGIRRIEYSVDNGTPELMKIEKREGEESVWEGTISIKGWENGMHTLAITVYDLSGNTASRNYTFELKK